VALLVWRTFSFQKQEVQKTAVSPASIGLLGQLPSLTLAGLLLSQGLRAWVNDSTNAYIPKFYLDQGLAPIQYGVIASTFLIGGSVGGLIGGFLADRWNKKTIVTGALILAAPSLYGFVHSGPDLSRLVLAFLAGSFLSLPFTPALMMFQGLMPNRLSTITGLAMTYMFMAGGIGTSATGILGDRIGLLHVLNISVGMVTAAAMGSLLISPFAGRLHTPQPVTKSLSSGTK
jgi:predicted MFS family arabinose efflux permease